MRIALILVGRTIPGFNDLLDTVNHTFRAKVSMSSADFPKTKSFNPSRKQYEAEPLLQELVPLAPDADIRLFITREDLFSEPFDFVFGVTLGKNCIVSTAHLDPRFYGEKDGASLFKERVMKEVLHELGHAMGMLHCEDKKCVMVFSNSVAGVDFKGKELCGRCRKFAH